MRAAAQGTNVQVLDRDVVMLVSDAGKDEEPVRVLGATLWTDFLLFGAERADLVVAGCAILEAILDIWPAANLGVADRGIREGILRSLMARDGYSI